jgi:malonyl-CoA decarboxylase
MAKTAVVSSNFLDRTVANLRRAWRGFSQGVVVAPNLPEEDKDWLRERIDDCLAARGGEASARSRAAELGRAYMALNRDGRARFLKLLAEDYDLDRDTVDRAAAALGEAKDLDARRRAERRLRAALVPPRVRLLTQFNALPQGVKFLVDLRAELLELVKDEPSLRSLDDDLRELLASWFDIGFLDLRQIAWTSPAALLEKLVAYEAVHQIRSWEDLKNRLDSDRRCFAFFHPRMPDEPLIFVEIALVNGIADSVQLLLDESAPDLDPNEADTAIFYSISNAQAGLAGVSFGDFLIKRVVQDLTRELPNLRTFATLSPVPGFRAWLIRQLQEQGEELLLPDEQAEIAQAAGEADAAAGLKALLNRKWLDDDAAEAALRPALLRLCARYLLVERDRGRAVDRVAHFHLTNGARLERINWKSDVSANGLRQSAGLMVNYLYKLSDIERNHEAYSGEGRAAASGAVRRLIKE